MTDIITKDRLELGIARGAYNFEYERLMPGMDAMEAGGRMRELVPAVQKLWKGDYAHDGKYTQFPSTTSAPKPLHTRLLLEMLIFLPNRANINKM